MGLERVQFTTWNSSFERWNLKQTKTKRWVQKKSWLIEKGETAKIWKKEPFLPSET